MWKNSDPTNALLQGKPCSPRGRPILSQVTQWCLLGELGLPYWRVGVALLESLGIPHTVLSVRRALQNWWSFLLYGTRLPLGQRWARLRMDCTADLLLVFVWDKTALGQHGAKQIICITFHSLCCSSLSQRQYCPIQKRGAGQLCSPFSVFILVAPVAVSYHTKMRRISSTRS